MEGVVPVVVHATSGADMRSISVRNRYLVDHAGADSPDPGDDVVVIPASPLAADSLERVGRIIRRHTIEPLLLAYPPTFDLSVDQRRLVASFGAPGIRIDDQSLIVTDRPLSTLGPDLDKWSKREHMKSRSQELRADFTDVIEFASAARSYFEMILRCPTQPCNNGGDLTVLEPRATRSPARVAAARQSGACRSAERARRASPTSSLTMRSAPAPVLSTTLVRTRCPRRANSTPHDSSARNAGFVRGSARTLRVVAVPRRYPIRILHMARGQSKTPTSVTVEMLLSGS